MTWCGDIGCWVYGGGDAWTCGSRLGGGAARERREGGGSKGEVDGWGRRRGHLGAGVCREGCRGGSGSEMHAAVPG